ncbi:HAMP domain-containing protein [Streptomyces sp. SBT349]|uniref:HAMP domain-containing protein n=1 Tax=Streptomyces sp. SBT349 TaxID=1580539 RepID=UPI00066DD827|nr:HAMP domain-containing protein [Streptomyces sp. SBT349]
MSDGAAARAGTAARTKRSRSGGTVEVDAVALNRLLSALEAMRDGNLRKRLTVVGDGPMAEIAALYNEVADRNLHLTGELARVRRVVGREGKLTERVETGLSQGAWAKAVDDANELVDDLVRPVADVGRVLTAVADGDLGQRMDLRAQAENGASRPLRGEFLRVGRTVNRMVDQLSEFTVEVTRVASEVGTEGKLGGQAKVPGVSGSWKDLTDSVNTMAARLTAQVRDISTVTKAVADGDLSRQVTVHVAGEMLELKNTVNTMVRQLSSFQSEVTRVAREVGTDGVLGGQARVQGVSGAWKDLTDSVNLMAGNLTRQVREISEVTRAVANGDLSQKITVTARGEVAGLADTLNAMTERLSSFADEVTRTAVEIGTDGTLGGQARVQGVAGVWKALTDSVNTAFRNLSDQVRDISEVTRAVANGDLSKKVTVDVSGEMLELKNTVNRTVDQLSSFQSEVTRVAREIGDEGALGGQASVKGLAGAWKDLTDSVNTVFRNLSDQVRDIAQVTTAVANGDLSQKVTANVSGEMLELKNTVNRMVDQLSSFADQVTRVATEVGIEGRLGGQASVDGVSGTWKALTDSVNQMAFNLTDQVRNIAQVTTAVARGDLSQKIDVNARGEILELKNTVNTMVDQLSSFAKQVTRVAREVGTEGRLGGQAQVADVAGVWRDLTDSVNDMASNLTDQVRNIAQVATAVARGDLSQKITVEARGEFLELKDTLNSMVDQLLSFADQVTRVAREVGTEGRLGGQAEVEGVAGTWKDLTQSVNGMANNLTSQVRNISEVTTAVASGDLTKKITVGAKGEILELVTTVNTMVDQLSSFADEVTRVAREVGTEGRLGGQVEVRGVSGTWKNLTDNVNLMARSLTTQVRNISEVATAVANGDLSRKVTAKASGEVAELADTVNRMVTTLSSFAAEVTRVAREVGTDGRLGGQANVPGVSGTWRDLTESVNSMASNLTLQVRNITTVTTAIAGGDLTKKIDIEARGEIQLLTETLNTMVDQLSLFAEQVTKVAREVGTEGQLGGQARVPGVAGTWKDLTDSVNEMAGNLTGQVRGIARVATFVTRGDHNVSISTDAAGEILVVQESVNAMIRNLRDATQVNKEQDWLKGNLARISALMQGRRDLKDVATLIMSELCPAVAAQHGGFYLSVPVDGDENLVAGAGEGDAYELRMIAAYGYAPDTQALSFRPGEGLIGTAAGERRILQFGPTPEGYLRISSGLGEAPPVTVIILPVLFEDRVLGVLELASFKPFTQIERDFLAQMAEMIATSVNTISVNTRTEMLLKQSQELATQLQDQTAELERQRKALEDSNAELKDKADLLAETNRNIEVKNSEIEEARRGLQERAEQLAVSMRYKSEFLANMSHELRTPLNSLLILAKLLADNAEGNLSPKQVEFAETIHGAGSDLLQLINDILDLSKVEAGKMDVSPARIALVQLVDYIEASFRPLTAEKNLEFSVRVSPELPATLHTDEQRLLQVLRNLLSNAVKFTDTGSVELVIRPAAGEVPVEIREQMLESGSVLSADAPLVAFAVSDTGIGIAAGKMRVIFEAFKQADGTTSRKYGGTGLGLSISREIARLLGGEIHAASEPGRGSTFTLYLPLQPTELPPPGYGQLASGTLSVEAGARQRPAAIEAAPAPAVVETAAEGGAEPGQAPAEGRQARKSREASIAAERAAESLTKRHRERFMENGHAREKEREPEPAAESEASQAERRRAFRDFRGRKVLIVDDDVRNVFALTSVLEQHGLRVLYAENGREGIEVLESNEDVALVLMDIMMPEMDGYSTTAAIRRMPQFAGLPIIALTAKAMKGDREKSIESGASDYVTKPVDTDHLLSVMGQWMENGGV